MKISTYAYIGTALVALSVIYLMLKNKPVSNQKSIKKDNKYDNEIKIKLEEIEQTFMRQAIGFYLQEKAFEKDLSKVEKEELFDKLGYKEEFSSPIIDWSSKFNFMKSHIDERDAFIREYLANKVGVDFCNDEEFVLNCFERYLLTQAKAKADKLI